jgi:hypothetical protein
MIYSALRLYFKVLLPDLCLQSKEFKLKTYHNKILN